MKSAAEIRSEMDSVEAELESARAELAMAEEEARKVKSEQENDPAWRAARWDYINKGDRSGIDNWYSRRDLRNQLAQQNVAAGNARSEEVYGADVEVRKAKRAYDNAVRNFPEPRTKEQQLSIDGLRDAYNDAVEAFVHAGGDNGLYGKIGQAPEQAAAGTVTKTGYTYTPYTNGLYNNTITGWENSVKNKVNGFSIPDEDYDAVNEYVLGLQQSPDYQEQGRDFGSRLSALSKYRSSTVSGKTEETARQKQIVTDAANKVTWSSSLAADARKGGKRTLNGVEFDLSYDTETGNILLRNGTQTFTIRAK